LDAPRRGKIKPERRKKEFKKKDEKAQPNFEKKKKTQGKKKGGNAKTEIRAPQEKGGKGGKLEGVGGGGKPKNGVRKKVN